MDTNVEKTKEIPSEAQLSQETEEHNIQLGESDNKMNYKTQQSSENNEDMPSKPAAVFIEAEMDLSLAVESENEELAILELRCEIEKMTSLPRPLPSRSLMKKVNKFESRLERAVMRMAELGAVEEEEEKENISEALTSLESLNDVEAKAHINECVAEEGKPEVNIG